MSRWARLTWRRRRTSLLAPRACFSIRRNMQVRGICRLIRYIRSEPGDVIRRHTSGGSRVYASNRTRPPAHEGRPILCSKAGIELNLGVCVYSPSREADTRSPMRYVEHYFGEIMLGRVVWD